MARKYQNHIYLVVKWFRQGGDRDYYTTKN